MSFKDAVFALAKPQSPTPYVCPFTGAKAYIRRFTVAERENYSRAIINAAEGDVNATGFSLIMCDKDGKRIFGDDDIAKIKELPNDLVEEALKTFNNQKLPTIEDAKKNS